MEAGTLVILIGSVLVLASILTSLLSSRIGAPLLLTFLGLGMLAGEAGPGGIRFDDAPLAILIGNCALVIILFDGGLRMDKATLRAAWAPALALSTLGVLVTAGVVAAAVHWALGKDWQSALLLGAIVAATDAAAVFVLAGRSGITLRDRLRATLEMESGSNDPMGIFLTIACVGLIGHEHQTPGWGLVVDFVWQMGLGGAVGLAGGAALVGLVNRMEMSAGLYPILAVAAALFTFSGTQLLGASGWLAVYLMGMVVGNRRVRAGRLVGRFFDGMAWLSQIVLFLMLGLLVAPQQLLDEWPTAVAVAGALILLARPAAVALCLSPFGFSWREQAFAAWVGLRGAVPIFLALFPLLAGIDNARSYFNIAFVVVIVSLAIQGWSLPWMARWLGVALSPRPEEADKVDLDAMRNLDRDLIAYTVKPHSRATDFAFAKLALPPRVQILTVLREGTVLKLDELDRLHAGDFVLVLVPPELSLVADRFFSRRFRSTAGQLRREQGDFVVDGATAIDGLAKIYEFPVRPDQHGLTVAAVLAKRLGPAAGRGDRVRFGGVELIVVDMIGAEIKHIGIALDGPPPSRLQTLGRWLGRFRRPARPGR